MERRTISIGFDNLLVDNSRLDMEMIIPVPNDVDAEEYIDGILHWMLSDEYRYDPDWDFVDGI